MSILPHNIVNDTKWQRCASRRGSSGWFCVPVGSSIRVDLHKTAGKDYLASSQLGWFYFESHSLPAAKAEALRLVREAVLAEAEAWK